MIFYMITTTNFNQSRLPDWSNANTVKNTGKAAFRNKLDFSELELIRVGPHPETKFTLWSVETYFYFHLLSH